MDSQEKTSSECVVIPNDRKKRKRDVPPIDQIDPPKELRLLDPLFNAEKNYTYLVIFESSCCWPESPISFGTPMQLYVRDFISPIEMTWTSLYPFVYCTHAPYAYEYVERILQQNVHPDAIGKYEILSRGGLDMN